MPDSMLPIQGLASQRERDLDVLLSGGVGYPAVVLGPVADVLAALRAAPAPSELDGEAAARAVFRLFIRPEAGLAGGAPAPEPLQHVAVAGQGRPGGQNPTVVLPPTVPAGPRHARPRPGLPWPGRWQAMAAASGAAAAVIVCVAALAGAFSGPPGPQARPGPQSSPQAASTSSKRPTSSVLGTATAHPTPRPSGSAQAASPAALCRQYMGFFTHPESPADWSAQNAVVKQLSGLAGGRTRIMGYCARQTGARTSWPNPGFHGGPGAPVPGNQPGRDGGGEPAMPRLGRAGPAVPGVRARSLSATPVRAGRTARSRWPRTPPRRSRAVRHSAGRRPVRALSRRDGAPRRRWPRRRPR
jgi:hypothetical protein